MKAQARTGPDTRALTPSFDPREMKGKPCVREEDKHSRQRESINDGPEVEQWGLECMRMSQEANGVTRGLVGHW